MDEQRQDDQLQPIYNSSVPIRGCNTKDLPEAMDDREGGKRESGIPVLMAWHDDDDDYPPGKQGLEYADCMPCRGG